MSQRTSEEIYEQVIKPMAVSERLRLIERIAHDLSTSGNGELAQRSNWASLRGVAPNLLEGEDVQAWISSVRAESDRHRGRERSS